MSMSCSSATEEPAWTPALQGRDRLVAVVAALGQDCVWTKSMRPVDMLDWLRSECSELEKELSLERDGPTRSRPSNDPRLRTPAGISSDLVAELGDVLFDTLMLHGACCRAFGISPDAAWNTAARKVEGRTPYMVWGDGVSTATTVEEAESHWRQAKRREKAAAAAAAAGTTADAAASTRAWSGVSDAAQRAPEARLWTQGCTLAQSTGGILAAGFVLGVIACHTHHRLGST